MAKYRSVNDAERVYPTLGLVVQPGETVDLPEPVDAFGLVLVESEKATKKTTTVSAEVESVSEGEPA